MRQRRSKSISYEILSCTPLLSVKEEIKNGLQILFNDRPVRQVHLVLVRIFNSGNMPIPSKDYEQPISLGFGEQSRILTAEITEKNPGDLPALIDHEEGRVKLEPTLLNQGDAITLKMLVNEYDNITVEGRIVGVKKIERSTRTPKRLIYSGVTGALLEISAVILTFLLPEDLMRAHVLIPVILMLLVIAGGSIAITSLITIGVHTARS